MITKFESKPRTVLAAESDEISVSLTRPLKFLITGDPGAGKSTMAKALYEEFGYPIFHTDMIMLKDGGTFNPYNEFVAKINEIIETNTSYIIDGCAFGSDPHLFEKVASDADLILNFDSPPQTAINSFFKRLEEFQKSGTAHLGMNMGDDYCSPRQFSFFLKYYADFISEKEKRKEIFTNKLHKVITINNFADADKVLSNLTAVNLETPVKA